MKELQFSIVVLMVLMCSPWWYGLTATP